MATKTRPRKASAPSPSRETSRAAGNGSNGKNAAFGAADQRALDAILGALTAACEGDFGVRLSARRGDVVGDVQQRVNELIEMNARMAKEMQRLARVVGREGRMTERATLPGVYGGWADSVEAVNSLVDDLVRPTTEVGRVIAAVAQGDLSQKMALTIEGQPVKGEFSRIGQTVNAMVDQLGSFADEVTRVAREVGTEGKLGGQAEVKGVSGTWRDLTESVNVMAANLTDQVRQIAQVTTAVANGDLTQKVTVEAKGEVAALAETINSMTDTLRTFAEQVTGVAREVGTEGVLGGQAEVPSAAGTWRDLTDSVNGMASNLTDQVRQIAQVTTAVANGDLSQKVTVEAKGEVAALAETINDMTDTLRTFAEQVTGVAREVGTLGVLGGQAEVPGVAGTWKDLTESVNSMATNLTDQVRNIAEVTTAVARGDLTQEITVDAQGEILELKNTINTMVDQLSSFADEVTRVAREVGTDGKLGGQAEVEGVSGTWRGLTENVNLMATNQTDQLRNLAYLTRRSADRDLTQKITVDAQGEIVELKDTINTMVDQLSSFADEVTRVAREVGTEGQLGGQAEVEGVSGTWRRLTENVNQLAGNLTTQIRAIKDVSTAVIQGDLTRQIAVEASGEVSALNETINQMIGNLRDTTQQNAEQDWLKTNLARITGAIQGQRDLAAVSRLIMSEVTPLVDAQHGAFFLNRADDDNDDATELRMIASYGYQKRKNLANRFVEGEGLVGQAALEGKSIVVTNAPTDYIKVTSGLGEALPVNLIVLPIIFEDRVLSVIELASLHPFTETNQSFLEQLSETIGVVLANIMANQRTEELLEQSQRLATELQERQDELQAQQEELKRSNAELEAQAQSLRASEELLQSQQEELRQTNEELQDKAALLAQQNRDIEEKNAEIERAREALEERAAQLALSSKYKSEFLANMSHELRTPLNSLLILSKLLADNGEGNLSAKQIEFAETIHNAGTELLSLISDILDLSKVEAGKMDVSAGHVPMTEITGAVERAFRPVAEERGLAFSIEADETAPKSLFTDEQRLQQILRNLLSNAMKFTETGSVSLAVEATSESGFDGTPYAAAFHVVDTGIGIPEDKLRLIFEAFQQADGTTSRRYG